MSQSRIVNRLVKAFMWIRRRLPARFVLVSIMAALGFLAALQPAYAVYDEWIYFKELSAQDKLAKSSALISTIPDRAGDGGTPAIKAFRDSMGLILRSSPAIALAVLSEYLKKVNYARRYGEEKTLEMIQVLYQAEEKLVLRLLNQSLNEVAASSLPIDITSPMLTFNGNVTLSYQMKVGQDVTVRTLTVFRRPGGNAPTLRRVVQQIHHLVAQVNPGATVEEVYQSFSDTLKLWYEGFKKEMVRQNYSEFLIAFGKAEDFFAWIEHSEDNIHYPGDNMSPIDDPDLIDFVVTPNDALKPVAGGVYPYRFKAVKPGMVKVLAYVKNRSHLRQDGNAMVYANIVVLPDDQSPGLRQPLPPNKFGPPNPGLNVAAPIPGLPPVAVNPIQQQPVKGNEPGACWPAGSPAPPSRHGYCCQTYDRGKSVIGIVQADGVCLPVD